MTAKPFIYVFNVDDTDVNNDELKAKLTELAPTDNVVFVSAKVEAEISQLDGEDAQMFMEEYGLQQSGLERLSKVGFDTLGLQTYLTAGPKESKAWTIPRSATAPQAAGVIHNDFERGFIAADIVSYEDLIAAGSWAKARDSGKLRTEGKTYHMQDGDVVEFKFNT
jgi:ribosome-binding ATPase YchF (GTP1/OBG family)